MKFMDALPQIEKLLRDEYGDNLIDVSTVERVSKDKFRVVYVVRAKIGQTEEVVVELSRHVSVAPFGLLLLRGIKVEKIRVGHVG